VTTIFTDIIEGKRPGFIIFEDDKHIAILDKYPIDTGHSLVIPKTPYEKITDMPKNDVALLFSLVPQVANAILKATGAVAFSIAQNNGKEALMCMCILFQDMPIKQQCGLREKFLQMIS
jgi:histidine triad (HIT) family protein